MRSFLTAMVLAASLTLLVPDNGAQAVNAAEAFGLRADVATQPIHTGPVLRESAPDREAPVDSDAAILLAFGFLGAVMARRLRAD